MSPARAILLHSPGHKPWVSYWNTFIEPQRGGTISPKSKCFNTRVVSVAPTELLIFCVHVYPGFHFGLCPHYTLGYEEVSCLKALTISLNFDVVALANKESKFEFFLYGKYLSQYFGIKRFLRNMVFIVILDFNEVKLFTIVWVFIFFRGNLAF